MTDTRKLKGKMVEHGFTIEEMAKTIGISTTSFSYKLNNKRQFVAEEIRDISKALQLQSNEIEIIFFG